MSDDVRAGMAEWGRWVAPEDTRLAQAVASWLAVRLDKHTGDWPPVGAFVRTCATQAQLHVRNGWDADAFDRDARLYALPGGYAWQDIVAAWSDLVSRPPGVNVSTGAYYRRRGGWPSRPELADRLSTSQATVKRAMEAAGQGTTWPPRDLTRQDT